MIAMIFVILGALAICLIAMSIVRSGSNSDRRENEGEPVEIMNPHWINILPISSPFSYLKVGEWEKKSKPELEDEEQYARTGDRDFFEKWKAPCTLLCFPTDKGTWRAATHREMYKAVCYYMKEFKNPPGGKVISGYLRYNPEYNPNHPDVFVFVPKLIQEQEERFTEEIRMEKLTPDTWLPLHKLPPCPIRRREKYRRET